jgi:hypothetical protein
MVRPRIVEVSVTGPGVYPNHDYQAGYVSGVWRAVEAVPEVSGGIVWCWADYRHRNGFTNEFPTYFGPFGIVTFDCRPKKAHAARAVDRRSLRSRRPGPERTWRRSMSVLNEETGRQNERHL